MLVASPSCDFVQGDLRKSQWSKVLHRTPLPVGYKIMIRRRISRRKTNKKERKTKPIVRLERNCHQNSWFIGGPRWKSNRLEKPDPW